MKTSTETQFRSVSDHNEGHDTFVFAVMRSLLTNYLPVVLCATYLLTMALPSLVSVYLFSVVRYGYLLYMALKKPVEQVFAISA